MTRASVSIEVAAVVALLLSVCISCAGEEGSDEVAYSASSDKPAQLLAIVPDEVVVEQGSSVQFMAFALDRDGDWFSPKVNWEAESEAGTINEGGLFTAGDEIGTFEGAVSATFGPFIARANITVTTPRSDFMWGFSHAVRPESIYVWSGLTYEEKLDRQISDFKAAGTEWYRPYIIWGDVDHTLEEPELALDDITDEMVEAYAFTDADKDWSKYDLLVDEMTDAGIGLFLVIAAGFTWELPYMDDGDGHMVHAIPDVIGPDSYIAQACLHARAAVRRYGDRVRFWVTEAELNMAGPTVLWGWRHGGLWSDWDFTTELLAALSSCVHAEDPDALVTMNFHTDILWKPHVRDWEKYLDIIAIDAFPNYISSDPVMGEVVGKRVAEALRLGTGKPVVVLETGYPTDMDILWYTEEKQAAYITEAGRAVFDAGGSGFFYFKLVAVEELGGGPWYQDHENHYGLVRTDDTYKKGFFAYQDLISEHHDAAGEESD